MLSGRKYILLVAMTKGHTKTPSMGCKRFACERSAGRKWAENPEACHQGPGQAAPVVKDNGIGRNAIFDREEVKAKVPAHLEGLRGLPKNVRPSTHFPIILHAPVSHLNG